MKMKMELELRVCSAKAVVQCHGQAANPAMQASLLGRPPEK